MKLLSDQDDIRKEEVGRELECQHCGIKYKIEESDLRGLVFKKNTYPSLTGFSYWYTYNLTCVFCKTKLEISTKTKTEKFYLE